MVMLRVQMRLVMMVVQVVVMVSVVELFLRPVETLLLVSGAPCGLYRFRSDRILKARCRSGTLQQRTTVYCSVHVTGDTFRMARAGRGSNAHRGYRLL